MKAGSKNWKTYTLIALPFLCIPLIKFYAPKVKSFYSEPRKCVQITSTEGSNEYCLDDNFVPPMECLFDEEQVKTERCISLLNLSEQNDKSVSFKLLSHEIQIKYKP